MHDTPTLRDILSVALPKIPGRPRLRFIDGPPPGTAPSDGPGFDEETDETDDDEQSQEDGDEESEDSDDENADEQEEGQQFDAAAAAERIRKKNRENANLRKRAKDAEASAAANKDAAEKTPALEAENLRLRVALKYGLPENLAKRLTGTTEEELLEDAQELLELTGTKRKTPPTDQPKQRLRGGGDPTETPVDETTNSQKFAASIFDN